MEENTKESRKIRFFFLVTEQLITRIGNVEIMSPYKSDHGTIALDLSISQEKRGLGSWKLSTDLIKDQELQLKIREELQLIKRTYALTPYEQINLEENEVNIEYNIKPDIMWEVMLVHIRGVIIDFAKTKKKRENQREKELITTITRLEENMQLNMEQLEILSIELGAIREDRLKGAQIRARSLKLNEGEKPTDTAMNFSKSFGMI